MYFSVRQRTRPTAPPVDQFDVGPCLSCLHTCLTPPHQLSVQRDAPRAPAAHVHPGWTFARRGDVPRRRPEAARSGRSPSRKLRFSLGFQKTNVTGLAFSPRCVLSFVPVAVGVVVGDFLKHAQSRLNLTKFCMLWKQSEYGSTVMSSSCDRLLERATRSDQSFCAFRVSLTHFTQKKTTLMEMSRNSTSLLVLFFFNLNICSETVVVYIFSSDSSFLQLKCKGLMWFWRGAIKA